MRERWETVGERWGTVRERWGTVRHSSLTVLISTSCGHLVAMAIIVFER